MEWSIIIAEITETVVEGLLDLFWRSKPKSGMIDVQKWVKEEDEKRAMAYLKGLEDEVAA